MTDPEVSPEGRVIGWFSCGAPSAVAVKLALADYPGRVEVVRVDPGAEHADNARFIADCEEWYGQEIIQISAESMGIGPHYFKNPQQVMRQRRAIAFPQGAPCTTELKKRVREAYQRPTDTHIWGFASDEKERADFWDEQDPGLTNRYPLIDRGIPKSDCLGFIRDVVGIRLPAMYELGFVNNNCFAGETEFITDEGVRTLAEMAGESCTVRGTNGGWKEARVASFGVQPLMKVTVHRGQDEREIFATAGHRWIKKLAAHGKTVERTTTELDPGDRLPSVFGALGRRVRPSGFGVAQGIVFGDGTRGKTLNTAATLVLCGDKNEQLLQFFPLSPKKRIASGVEVRDLPRFWKDPPRLEDESQSFLYGWLSGYFAADGNVSRGSCILTSARRDDLVVARDVAVRLGIGVNPIRSVMRKGYGEVETELFSLPLIAATVREDFFLIAEHLDRFMESERRAPHPWFVKSVELTDRVEEVFCAVVPDGQAFTLEGNILTGNCIGCPKAGFGHWNMVRDHFPDRFAEQIDIEEDVGHATLAEEIPGHPTRKKRPVWLRDLDPERGDIRTDPKVSCSLNCMTVEQEMA